jgi:hypothetical protein
MRKKYVFGLLFIIFGFLIAIGPETIFYVCDSGGDMVMKCHYTAQTELALGIEIAIFGAILAIQKSRAAQAATSISLVLSGIFALLVPNVLIGVCDGVHMHCNAVAKPALSLLGIAVVIIALISFARLYREGMREHE